MDKNEIESTFPTGDITMISIDLFEKQKFLKELKESLISTNNFSGKNEAIAELTITIRHIEDAEYRILKAKEYILSSVK